MLLCTHTHTHHPVRSFPARPLAPADACEGDTHAHLRTAHLISALWKMERSAATVTSTQSLKLPERGKVERIDRVVVEGSVRGLGSAVWDVP